MGNKVWCEYNEWTIDAPALIVVEEPLAEPRVHLKGCVAGLRGLKEYVKEVLEGVNDWRIGRDWHYTYHERIFSYLPPVFRNDEEEVRRLDQIEYVVRKLRKAPESRRAIVVIWQPWKDEMTDYPPCLVYLWFRVMDDLLELHVHMRSLDYREPVPIYRDGEISLVPIGEVYDEKLWKDALVPSVNERLGIEWVPVKNCLRHELQRGEKIYEVRLLSGRWIRLSKDHALYTIRGGRLVAVPTSSLRKGDLVLIPRRLPRPVDPVKVLDVPSTLLKSGSLEQMRRRRTYLRLVGVKRRELERLKPVLYKLYREEYRMKNVRSAVWNAVNRGYVPIEAWHYLREKSGVRLCFFNRHTGLPTSIPLDEEFGYVVGLWLAEGSIRGGRKPLVEKRKVYGIQFSINASETDIASRVEGFFKSLGINVYYNRTKAKEHEMIIEVPNKAVEALFRYVLGLEEYSPQRRAPKIAFNAPESFIRGLLKGHLDGDAHCSSSRELISDLQYLYLLLGRVALAYFYEKRREITFPDGRKVVASPYGKIHSVVPPNRVPLMVRRHGTPLHVRISKTTDVTFDVVKEIREVEPTCCYVYDLSVPPYENFIGGHGGIVCHNSNDALKAAFMNMYAYIELQRLVADRLGYGVGRYIHFADSYHIYERDWKWAEKFVEQIERQETPRYWLPSSKLG